MGTDPAFLFYPNDYIGGTMGMTFEEKGAYIELLMLQFNRGHMTSHMIGQTVGQLWVKVEDKFVKDADGLWYNVRLEEEKIKRSNFVSSRINNKLGKNQYNNSTKKERGHMTSHMEDENKDVIKIEYKDNVNLFKKEYDTLLEKYGKTATDWMIDKLGNYKLSKGKKYKSDYGAINTWVVDEAKKKKIIKQQVLEY